MIAPATLSDPLLAHTKTLLVSYFSSLSASARYIEQSRPSWGHTDGRLLASPVERAYILYIYIFWWRDIKRIRLQDIKRLDVIIAHQAVDNQGTRGERGRHWMISLISLSLSLSLSRAYCCKRGSDKKNKRERERERKKS